MLILSRHPGEIIRIGHDIKIQVVRVFGDKVRIGISAPRHVAVHRQEVYEAIQKSLAELDNGQSGQSDPPADTEGSEDAA